MAKTNEYIGEAYDTLLNLSADDKERLAYEARQKAIWDYNSQMGSARRQGLREGEEIGLQKGEKIGFQKGEEIGLQKGERDKTISVISKLLTKKMTDEEICEIAGCDGTLIDEVRKGL